MYNAQQNILPFVKYYLRQNCRRRRNYSKNLNRLQHHLSKKLSIQFNYVNDHEYLYRVQYIKKKMIKSKQYEISDMDENITFSI